MLLLLLLFSITDSGSALPGHRCGGPTTTAAGADDYDDDDDAVNVTDGRGVCGTSTHTNDMESE